MIREIEIYYLLFILYAFFGWIIESTYGAITLKKLVNRGFLIGPYCPVYGVGMVLLYFTLKSYANDFVVLVFLSMIICGSLEYFTSYIMEKLFKARWWNYDNFRFNINGRICLETILPFGIFGAIFIRYINPFFLGKIQLLSSNVLMVLSIITFVLFLTDIIISTKIIRTFKSGTEEIKDNTEEVSELVRETTKELADKLQKNTRRFARKLKLNTKKFTKKVRFFRKKKVKAFPLGKIKEAVGTKKNSIHKSIVDNAIFLQEKIVNIKNEKFIAFKNKFRRKSKLHKRLLESFPDVDIKDK